MRITLRGRRYRLEEVARLPGDRFGDCTSPLLPHRLIRVRRSLKGQRRLEVILHEALHACLWDLDEEAIEETAHDLARLLWRLGYGVHKDDTGTD